MGDSAGYTEEAQKILPEAFIIISPDDPRLSDASVSRRTCEVTVNFSRGFFSVTGWVDVKDHDSGDFVAIVQTRRGMFYAGAKGDVIESLNALVAARKKGAPLPQADAPAGEQPREAQPSAS